MFRKQHINDTAYAALEKGEEAGLDYFFKLYYTPLLLFANSIIQNQEAAKDVVAESFVKLWRLRTEVASAENVKHLLYRVVKHACIDVIRREKMVKEVHGNIISTTTVIEKSISERITEAETYHRLYRELNMLPEKCREVVALFYLEEKSVKEIAEIMKVSVNTVKSQKQRAIDILKKRRGLLWICNLGFVICNLA